ncbi:MAG TPA: hypothetical protein VFG63_05490 [Nocardioidaceae bacterium]|nr:hypothetical protein [Nocardioidaceae bacterium]
MSPELTIPARFSGPPTSANGGYTAGLLAELVTSEEPLAAVEVTLRQPPPLEVGMRVLQLSADHPATVAGAPLTVLSLGGARIAEGRVSDADPEPVEAVPMGRAAEAMGRFPGLVSHPFPTCFSCGPDRHEGDGLRIFPGPVGTDTVASLWVPDANLAESSDLLDEGVRRVGPGTAWAALDCAGGWAGDMEERKMVLGRMTAQVDALPVVGEPHVVVGAARGSEGRKTFTASTLYDSDGRIVARAQHVWIAVDPAAFG